MPIVRIRIPKSLPPLWGKFILSTFSIGIMLAVAFPSNLIFDFVPLKAAVKRWVPIELPLPDSYIFEKQGISLVEQGIPFDSNAPYQFGLDIQGGTQVTLAADMSSIPDSERERALKSVEEVIRRRIDYFGVSEPRVRTSVLGEEHRILVELPGISQPQAALELIGQTARLNFKAPSENSQELYEAAMASEEAALAYIASFKETPLDGKMLERATMAFDPTTNEPTVALQFNQEGSALFTQLTTDYTGKTLAIFIDDQPLSLPVVNEPIYGGQAVISGSFTVDQAQALVAQLNAGALPVSLSVVEQKTVGPSLGATTLQKSFAAGFVGLVLVATFMILLYGAAGVLATVGLIAYGVVTLALYKLIPVTLTLPGIAGLVLSIGMAVDANILTFARIKEEQRAGKPWKQALKNGFGRSWESIKGANIATLAICFVLFNPMNLGWLHTSGPVRGFALTLALGIGVSLFTGVFYSRLLLQLFLAPPQSEKKDQT